MQKGQEFNPYKVFVGIFIPNAIVKCQLISPGAKICYGRLAQYAGDNGIAYPSHKALADEMGVKERQVRNYIKELKDNHFIKVKHSQTSNRYYFLWHEVLEESMKVNISTRQDNATPAGKILPPQLAGSCQGRESLSDSSKEREPDNPPAPPPVTPKNEKPKTPTNGLIGYYIGLYRDRFGHDYPVTKGTDHGIIKNLVTEHGAEMVREILRKHVSTNDRWILDRGCSLTTIKNSLPEYLIAINQARVEEESEARRREQNRIRQEELKRLDEEAERKRAEFDALPEAEKARIELENYQERLKVMKPIREAAADQGDQEAARKLEEYDQKLSELKARLEKAEKVRVPE